MMDISDYVDQIIKTRINKRSPNEITDFNHPNGENMKDFCVIKNDDLIQENTESANPNPYKIAYELFDGHYYPVITLPADSLMFTGRKIDRQISFKESMANLYSLAKVTGGETIRNSPDFFNKQREQPDTFRTMMKYFYPIPYFCNNVSKFDHINCVVLNRDIRLLCLCSPAYLSKASEFPHMRRCGGTHQNDLCLSKELMEGLQIHGYIGVDPVDSVHDKIQYIEKAVDMAYGLNFEDTALFSQCTFMNDNMYMNNYDFDPASNAILDVFTYKRPHSVPEIYIMPFDMFGEVSFETAMEDFFSGDDDYVPGNNFIFNSVFECYSPNYDTDIYAKVADYLYDMRFEIYKYTNIPGIHLLVDNEDGMSSSPDISDDDMSIEDEVNNFPVGDSIMADMKLSEFDFTNRQIDCCVETVGFYQYMRSKNQRFFGGRHLVATHNDIGPDAIMGIKNNVVSPPPIMKNKKGPPRKLTKTKYGDIYYHEIGTFPIFHFRENSRTRIRSVKRKGINKSLPVYSRKQSRPNKNKTV